MSRLCAQSQSGVSSLENKTKLDKYSDNILLRDEMSTSNSFFDILTQLSMCNYEPWDYMYIISKMNFHTCFV